MMVVNIYQLFLRLPIWTIKVAKLLKKMVNMNIKGSPGGRIIRLNVNWNTNYDIAIFVYFSVRCSSIAIYFYVDNFNELNATLSKLK